MSATVSSIDRTAVVDRVRKLRALATAPNEHEARNAQAIADRLMSQHGIGEVDLTADPAWDIEDDPFGSAPKSAPCACGKHADVWEHLRAEIETVFAPLHAQLRTRTERDWEDQYRRVVDRELGGKEPLPCMREWLIKNGGRP